MRTQEGNYIRLARNVRNYMYVTLNLNHWEKNKDSVKVGNATIEETPGSF